MKQEGMTPWSFFNTFFIWILSKLDELEDMTLDDLELNSIAHW